MGNRCPSCEKFVSLEVGEPEVEGVEVFGNNCGVEVMVQARLVRTCAECGEELRQISAENTETFDIGALRQGLSGDSEDEKAFEAMLNSAKTGFRDDIEIDWEGEESGDAEAHEDGKGRNRQVVASVGVTLTATYRVPLPPDAPADAEEPDEVTVEFGLSAETREDFSAFEECC